MTGPVVAYQPQQAQLIAALGSFPPPDNNGLRQATSYWASLAAVRAAAVGKVPWAVVPVVPQVVPIEFVYGTAEKPATRTLDHKQPGQWIERDGQVLACPIAWKRNWPHEPTQAASKTIAAINLAERLGLPIGLGLILLGGGGALALDADAKQFADGEAELRRVMAPALSWAAEHGLYTERSGSGGAHVIGILPEGAEPLGGKFGVGDADNAGEVRGGAGNGFLVVAPTWIAGKAAPYTTEHQVKAAIGAHYPISWATIGIRPYALAKVPHAVSSNGHKGERKPRSSTSGAWQESGPGAPCPCCGRDSTTAFSWLPNGELVS